MGNMASEIQRRIEEDGGAGLAGEGAAASGTGETQATQQQSSAGTQNADTAAAGGTSQTIPYSRFQEVNSQLQELRPWRQVQEMGIEPDSAVRLANFERAYLQDPEGVVSSLVDQLDLPDEAKTAIKEHLGAQAEGDVDGAGQASNEGQQTPPALPEEVQQDLQFVRQLREERATHEQQQRLDVVVSHWDALDKESGFSVPEKTKLTYIMAVAPRGNYQTLEEMAEAARAEYLEQRELDLGSAVAPRRAAGSGLTVPGGAAQTPASEGFRPRSFKDANNAVLADIAAGRLPSLTPEGN